MSWETKDGWCTNVTHDLVQVWKEDDTSRLFVERQGGLLWYVVERPHIIAPGSKSPFPPRLAGPFEELDAAKVAYLIAIAVGA